MFDSSKLSNSGAGLFTILGKRAQVWREGVFHTFEEKG